MPRDASELARRLAREAEACAAIISPTASARGATGWWAMSRTRRAVRLFVRLHGIAKGPAGKWTDAATGEHGDLLDIIRESLGFRDFREVAEEARRFLNLPRAGAGTCPKPRPPAVQPDRGRRPDASLRFRDRSKELVELYLRRRGIVERAPRWQSRAIIRAAIIGLMSTCLTEIWPAMIAAVTDLDGTHHRGAPHVAGSGWL